MLIELSVVRQRNISQDSGAEHAVESRGLPPESLRRRARHGPRRGGADRVAARVLVSGLTGGTETSATVLRKVAENSVFIDREHNNAFVVNLYFSYLRRDPEPGGFNFWLNQINSTPLRNVPKQQALVCSFITSQEYQERFSSVITRTNAECGP